MIDFRQLVKKSILGTSLPGLMSKNRVSPKTSEITDTIIYEFNTIFSRTKTDPVGTNVPVSLSQLKTIGNRISLWFDAITFASEEMDKEFQVMSDKYIRICRRIINNNKDNRNKLNELLNYSCHHIDNIDDRDKHNTSVANIGSYITLPFSFADTKIYNGKANFTLYTTDNLSYSNESTVSTLPLPKPLSMKYTAASKTSTVTLSVGLNDITTNLIYINCSGDVDSITVTCMYRGTPVAVKTIEDKECLFNFNKTLIDSLSFTITSTQLNLAKQSALNINDITIFDSIYFMSSGVFESVPVMVDKYLNASKLVINAKDFNVSSHTQVDKYMSIAMVQNVKSFIKVSDSLAVIEVPISKIVNVKKLDNLSAICGSMHVETVRDPADPRKEIQVSFFKYDIDMTSDLKDLNYKTIAVMAGTNDAYGEGFSITNDRDIFENWTRVDNTYKTMIVNYELNVKIDIGAATIKINGKDVTGAVTIPVGISLIEVHESLFDKTFGSRSTSSSFNGISNNAYVHSDPLFPNNFAYKLAGLPEYEDSGSLPPSKKRVDKDVYNVTVVQLDTPFLPLSVEVRDTLFDYELYIGYAPIKPGTFTVEPNKGIIRIFAKDENHSAVSIYYTRAQRNFRSCGILFNRLQKYINFRAIHNMISQTGRMDDTYISFIASSTERSILIPEIKNTNIFHNRLLYTTSTDSAYIAVQMHLKTTSNELSPVIKNIFLEGRK